MLCPCQAYNLDSKNGSVGDVFLNNLMPISTRVPYLGVLGNHEQAFNFSHFTNKFTAYNDLGQASGSNTNWSGGRAGRQRQQQHRQQAQLLARHPSCSVCSALLLRSAVPGANQVVQLVARQNRQRQQRSQLVTAVCAVRSPAACCVCCCAALRPGST